MTPPVAVREARGRWSASRARSWYEELPWLIGCNFIPSYAVNVLEMWQEDTFDLHRIDQELQWGEGLGLNVLRVFVHDLLWKEDRPGLVKRLRGFLDAAERHRQRAIVVLFDSCWDPDPKSGPQLPAVPGVCLSRWVQSPGARGLSDPRQHRRLEGYVSGLVSEFAGDDRVLAWDLWNEPDHEPDGQTAAAFGAREPPDKVRLVEDLLPKVFGWARSSRPSQPLTSALWKGDWSLPERFRSIERIQLELSDIITFHSYDPPSQFRQKIRWLLSQGRPLLCTEYMARVQGSTFAGALPIARRYGVGMIHWGLVVGKTQTNIPWDSWLQPYVERSPSPWFHDVLRGDGSPYDPQEASLLLTLSGSSGSSPYPRQRPRGLLGRNPSR